MKEVTILLGPALLAAFAAAMAPEMAKKFPEGCSDYSTAIGGPDKTLIGFLCELCLCR